MSTITQLQTTLSELKRKLDSFQQTAQQTSKPQPLLLSNTASKGTNSVQSASDAEKKFNIVVYEIPECPQNTNRQTRLKKELETVIEVLSNADNDIEPSDIKDLHCLGKYDPKSERPRPLLVKLLRSNMALEILSSKSKLEAPVYIEPDMTLHKRQKERLLLKERRSLIGPRYRAKVHQNQE